MTVRSAAADIAVIGAGSSGLAALKALLDPGVAVDCFERGSDVGGLRRYENDNGLSGGLRAWRRPVGRRNRRRGLARLASRTLMAVRSRTHVLPRWIGGKPYDTRDIDSLNRIPWRLMNFVYGLRVARELGPTPVSWPVGVQRLLEGIPIVSSDLLPAVLDGDVVVKPAVDRLRQDRVHFVDGSEEMVDCIIYCTGYRISIPFLSSSLSASGRDFPLYRRIVPPDIGGLLFVGFVDAPGGLLPVVEAQGEWIAAVLAGQLRLPTQKRMWHAIERPERRTRQRFPGEEPESIRCDPHAYRRLLLADLRQAHAGHQRNQFGLSPCSVSLATRWVEARGPKSRRRRTAHRTDGVPVGPPS